MLGRIAEYRAELEQKSKPEIDALLESEKAIEAREIAAIEKAEADKREAAHRFNQPWALASGEVFDYWAKASFWKIEEATALLLERNPKVVTLEAAKADRKGSRIGRSFKDLHELLRRAYLARQIGEKSTPGRLLAWAKRNRIPVPADLETAVRDHGHQVADWKTAFDQKQQDAVGLQERLAVLEQNRAASPSPQQELGTRERESLLRLIIGMAVKGYAFAPHSGRSAVPKEIANDLELLGIPLSDDTVRKYLREGTELLPPQDDK